MKKVFLFAVKFMLALVAGVMMLVGAIALDWSDRAVLSVYLFGTILVALLLGVFDEPKRKRMGKHMTISEALRSLRKAA